jgi:hypothetical protein
MANFIYTFETYSVLGGSNRGTHKMNMSIGGQCCYETPGALLTLENGPIVHEVRIPLDEARQVAAALCSIADSMEHNGR